MFEGRPEWRWTHALSNEEAFKQEIVSRYDVLVLYDFVQALSPEGKGHLQAFAEAGKGIVVLHHALADYQDWPWFEEMAGGRYLMADQGEWKASTYRHDVELFAKPAGKHPIVDPIGPMQLVDETYKGMRISPKVTPLLEIDHPDGDRYVAWVSPYQPSRVVAVQLGHDEHAHRSQAYRRPRPERDRLVGKEVTRAQREKLQPSERFWTKRGDPIEPHANSKRSVR